MITDRTKEIVDAVDTFGDREAARRLGINRGTIHKHLVKAGRRAPSAPDASGPDGLSSDPSRGFEETLVIRWFQPARTRLRVYPIGDFHLGAPEHAGDRLAEWIDYIVATPDTSVAFTGDLFNAALKDSKSESYDDVMTVGTAIPHAIRLLSPLAEAGKLDVMIPGNHDLRVYRSAGIDPVKIVADTLDVPYARSAALLVYDFGTVEYDVYIRHGTGSGQNLAQLAKAGTVMDADVYVTGHLHRQAITKDDTFVREGNSVVRKTRLFVSSGSFVNYAEYAAERGHVPGRIGAPRIYLDGERKDVHGSI